MPSTTSSGPLTSSHRLLNDIRERILGSGHDTSIAISLLIQAIESPGISIRVNKTNLCYTL